MHRAEHQLVAHRTAVDEQILRKRIARGVGRQRREAFDTQPFASAAHRDRIGAEIRAENVAKPREPSRWHLASAAAQVTGARSSPASVKATSGRLIASRRTTRAPLRASVRSLFRNFSRAGVA